MVAGKSTLLAAGHRLLHPQAGTQLGRYEIVAPLGAGGMGEVYRACDPWLERDVAIRVLPEDFAAVPDASNGCSARRRSPR